ncbi:MAG: hypothetical protein MK214_02800 [Thalassotalea sp.]|nr:hypothetical protein [Thalassotalea sp.]
MAKADKESIKGNFDYQQVEHYEQNVLFYSEGGSYFVNINYGENKENLTIKYTFGNYPLQQYIVETSKGRFQILPFAWDSRPLDEGGQRWFHSYEQENITLNDRLH